jgi:hypothetical protein
MKAVYPMKLTLLNSVYPLLKDFSRIPCLLLTILLATVSQNTSAQCGTGYTAATVNWDNLDYLHANGYYSGVNPVTGQPFVPLSMWQTQKFAIGTNFFTTSTTIPAYNAAALSGDRTVHTGNAGSHAGADIHFDPTTDGQTITLTFDSEVQNLSFTLNDIDRGAIFTINATNSSGVLQTINYTLYASTILTAGGSSNWRIFTAPNTNPGYTANTGAVTISIAGPLKNIVIKDSIIGSNDEFFLSDITACVADPGFPTNYHNSYTQPFTGQPSYFLANPQNLHVYMVNAGTAQAHYLFSDPGTSGNKMNSLAYDPVNHWLYYIMDNAPLPNGPLGNFTLKKYDFGTETISTVLADIKTMGIPCFEQGVEFAGAAFYNGSLYLGIEGSDGIFYGTNAESVIWRIDFDGTGNPLRAVQAFATPGDDGGGTVMHDWGDFIVKDGTIITHATSGSLTSNQYIHVDMQNNTTTTYTGNAEVAGQLGATYNGNIYRVKNSIALYNNNGTIGSTTAITVSSCSPAWVADAGDASDPFKPKCDFGDAPATYDPVALSPAANQKDCNNSTLRIGSAWGDEWSKNSTTDASGDDEEDGIGTVAIMVSDGISYNHVQEVTVLNNTGATAYLAGWLDHDADGVFEASEGVVMPVTTNASPQTITLAWNNITIASGTPNSFLRVRLYSGTLTTNDATGWFSDGETEDYPVISQSMPLMIQLFNFNATVTKEKNVMLSWKATADEDASGFEVESSIDQVRWEKIARVDVNRTNIMADYNYLDQQPVRGRSYYRLKLLEASGASRYSPVRSVQIDQLATKLNLYPNPAKNDVTILFNTTQDQNATLLVRSVTGAVMIKKTITLQEGENRMKIYLNGFSHGLYIVELTTSAKTYINKLTLTH